jgi:hypothetical protein
MVPMAACLPRLSTPAFEENLEKTGAEIYEVAPAYADGEWPVLEKSMRVAGNNLAGRSEFSLRWT